MYTKRLSWIVAFALGLLPIVSVAQVQFSFIYQDAAGVGFNDNTLGASRKAALEAAAANYATAFSSYNATIEVEVSSFNNPLSGTLMSAGTYFVGPLTGFGVGEVTRTKIITNGGTDWTSGAEAVLSVNFGRSWEFDYNAPNPQGSGVFDWYGVLYHEFTHMVGFGSGIKTDSNGQNATDLFNNTTNGNWAAFDEFLTDPSGNSVFTNFDLNTATYESLLVGGTSFTNGLHFDLGNNNLVGLYTPTTFRDGSSGSHLDTDNSAYDDMLMVHAVSSGLATRDFSQVEIDILEAIGYTNIQNIGVVPEPKQVALGLGGIALAVVIVWRRLHPAKRN